MLHHKPCERHGEVIPQPLFTYLQRKSLAVVAVLPFFKTVFVEVNPRKSIPRIEYAEKEFVALFPVFSEQRAEIFH